MACRQGTLTPPDTWSCPFGTCICSTYWDQSFSELVVILPDYALRISLGTFSILLRLVFENLSRIADKISLLRGTKHCVYVAASFTAIVTSGCLRKDTQIFNSVLLNIYIIYIAQWLFGGYSEILHYSDVLHAVRNFLNQKAFSSKHVSTFLPQKDYVTAKPRALFAWRGSNYNIFRTFWLRLGYVIVLRRISDNGNAHSITQLLSARLEPISCSGNNVHAICVVEPVFGRPAFH